MCMNGLLVVMAFAPLFGLWSSSFHAPKLVKNLQKMKYLQNICANAKTTNYRAEVRMVSDFDIKFMPLSRINKG